LIEFEVAAECFIRVGDEEMFDEVCWICSYVVVENGGLVGIICIY